MSGTSCIRLARVSWIGAAAGMLLWGAVAAQADQIVGTLSTNTPVTFPVGVFNASIPSPDVSTWMAADIPAASKSLVTLTECYGGNAASAFKGANTAVLSATSPFQLAQYGGFDSGASAALKPGAANTGQTVFNAGVAAKAASETPITAGALAPAAFSLAPAAAAGAVQGRQVLVYAGQPGGPNNDDNTQAMTIQNNFAAEALSKVTTIGDSGNAPWNVPGDGYNLQNQIESAGNAMGAAANPANQQFALYVTDHGGLRNVATALNRTSSNPTPNTTIPVNNMNLPLPVNPAMPGQGQAVPTLIAANFSTFVDGVGGVNPAQINPNGQGSQQPASPVFSVLLPFADGNNLNTLDPLGQLLPGIAKPSNWTLYLESTVMGNPSIQLTGSFERVYTPDSVLNPNNFAYAYNAAGDANKDAGVEIEFQVTSIANPYPQPGTPGFDDIFLNNSYDVYVVNSSGNNFNVGEFGQDLSLVAPTVPEPGSIAVLLGFAGMFVRRPKRRS